MDALAQIAADAELFISALSAGGDFFSGLGDYNGGTGDLLSGIAELLGGTDGDGVRYGVVGSMESFGSIGAEADATAAAE